MHSILSNPIRATSAMVLIITSVTPGFAQTSAPHGNSSQDIAAMEAHAEQMARAVRNTAPQAPEFCGTSGGLPLGLKRLAGIAATPGEKTPAANSYEVVNITSGQAPAGSNGSTRQRKGVSFVEIEANGTWEQPLRGLHNGISYTTFTILGSIGTQIDIGGAKIAIVPSEIENYAAFMIGYPSESGIEWKPLNHETPLVLVAGRTMANLAAVTVRADSEKGVWAIFLRDYLAAENLPLVSTKPQSLRNLVVNGGNDGAWACELACSDVNPLFED
jgi:hypothetical protein